MLKFFRTWVDWWFFIPVCLVLSIGSYWFVPFILRAFGMPEQDMAYTGTSWLYDMFKAMLIFFLGSGMTGVVYRWYIPFLHQYFESDLWNKHLNTVPEFKMKLAIAIPAALMLYWCLICIAVF